MPVEQAAGRRTARRVTPPRGVGRLLAGIAPWLELPADDTPEGRLRARVRATSRGARIASAVDPASPDFLNFTDGGQPLVDAAFLAQGVLRAPRALREALDAATTAHLVARARVDARHHARLQQLAAVLRDGRSGAGERSGAPWDRMRVDYALRQHEQWYKGDGVYGDGPTFHWDYYNSFVIHPMLLDVLDACARRAAGVEGAARARSSGARGATRRSWSA